METYEETSPDFLLHLEDFHRELINYLDLLKGQGLLIRMRAINTKRKQLANMEGIIRPLVGPVPCTIGGRTLSAWGGLSDVSMLNLDMRREQILHLRDATSVQVEQLKAQKADRDHRSIDGTPMGVFDSLDFHPALVDSVRGLFRDGHYAEAIFEAFKLVEVQVREKSGLVDKMNANLMATEFNESNPILRLNEFIGLADRDEQEGFRLIFMGSMKGIRNPGAHTSSAPKVESNIGVPVTSQLVDTPSGKLN